jgi:hypothetical protein
MHAGLMCLVYTSNNGIISINFTPIYISMQLSIDSLIVELDNFTPKLYLESDIGTLECINFTHSIVYKFSYSGASYNFPPKLYLEFDIETLKCIHSKMLMIPLLLIYITKHIKRMHACKTI